MKKLVNTSCLSHEEWLAYRRKGIGGSDAAAVCGLSPWKSAYAVFLDKTGQVLDVVEDNERMRVGRDLEDYVAKRFEEASGKKVRRNNFILGHDDYDFIYANIDREVVGEKALLECKTTSSYGKKAWEDGVPLHYEFQCQHYLLVTGYERCYIAVLIGNEAFAYYTIERDEETLAMLLEHELRFWNDYVLTNTPPPPDGSKNYDDRLLKKYEGGIEDAILLPLSYEEIVARIDAIKQLEKDLKTEKTVHEQTIKKELGNHEIAFLGERRITWKTSERTTLDTDSIKEKEPDVYEKYKKIKTIRTLRI